MNWVQWILFTSGVVTWVSVALVGLVLLCSYVRSEYKFRKDLRQTKREDLPELTRRTKYYKLGEAWYQDRDRSER